jgi:hypothetical protein
MRNKLYIILLILLLCIFSTNVYAGSWTDNWDFNICGIDPKDFKDRSLLKITGGALLSVAAHELGHMAVGTMCGIEMNGFGTGGYSIHVDSDSQSYDEASDTQKTLYHAGGFIGQILVGSVLTAIPETRHSDWTLGFNAFNGINSAIYGIGGGRNEETSDVAHIDETWDDNGTEVALTSSIIGFGLSYINLNKHKGD